MARSHEFDPVKIDQFLFNPFPVVKKGLSPNLNFLQFFANSPVHGYLDYSRCRLYYSVDSAI